jgi:hypothetical protein
MRTHFVLVCIAFVAFSATAQNSSTPSAISPKPDDQHKSTSDSFGSDLKAMFESKIKVEWEALKNKDKKAYGDLLADDYQGVEVDGRGERNKIQSVNEVAELNVYDYTIWGYKLTPLGPDAAFVVYEVTMQFPPMAQVRYGRVYISELWLKRSGQWKVVHYQETHVK